MAAQKWRKVRVVITQPYLTPAPIGLASFEVHSADPSALTNAGTGVAPVVAVSVEDDEDDWDRYASTKRSIALS